LKLIDISTRKYPDTFAIVDDADFEHLNQWKWHAERHKKTIYARRCNAKSESPRRLSMHREVLGAPVGIGIDHKDGNGLNNQRSNLRPATDAENNRNRAIQRNNTSGYVGVVWHKGHNRWRAKIKVDGKNIHITENADIMKAVRARDTAAIKYFGEFAKLNFPITTNAGEV
jgi:hypothetical protein